MSEDKTKVTDKFIKKINGWYIDPQIFTYRFICNCPGECCHYGVFTDLKEYESILSIKERIIENMDETQPKDVNQWFEDPETDEDFDSGFAVGTEVFNDKCVFLDKNGLCSLQKIAIQEGAHKWKYKPVYCVLFPLTTFEGAITIDDEHIDRLPSCNRDSNSKLTIFEACEEELKHFLGEVGFNDLKQYREEYLNEIKKRINADVTR